MKSYILDNPAGQNGRFNLGDDIQVLAAQRFGDSPKELIDKNKLNMFRGAAGNIIMNGWFMHDPENWPPAPQLRPLLTSFHMNPVPAARMLEQGHDFFKQYGPVGCRDYQTLEIFEKAKLPSYFSGCLTLTLERDKFIAPGNTERTGIFSVDLFYKMKAPGGVKNRLRRILRLLPDTEKNRDKMVGEVLDRVVPHAERNKVRFIEHSRPIHPDNVEARHAAAREVLGHYAGASLVVTSRIHCALPCLAFGTPVIFVDGALGHQSERARLRGIIDLMPVLCVDQCGKMDIEGLERDLHPEAANRRASALKKMRADLISQCAAFADEK